MQDRNLTEGLEISSALSSGSYRKGKYKRMRVSRSGMLIVHNLLWARVVGIPLGHQEKASVTNRFFRDKTGIFAPFAMTTGS